MVGSVDGAGYFSVPERPTNLDNRTVLAAGAGGRYLDTFFFYTIQ